jgi:hypothetical protein
VEIGRFMELAKVSKGVAYEVDVNDDFSALFGESESVGSVKHVCI